MSLQIMIKNNKNNRSEYWLTMVDILDAQFPKGECKERGKALVLLSYIEMMLQGVKFDEEGRPKKIKVEEKKINKKVEDLRIINNQIRNKNMNKYLIIVLKEMFKRVKVKFPKDEKYFQKEDWFRDNEWTDREQEDFKEWFISYLQGNKEARQNLMKFPLNNKKSLEKVANEFIMTYGWKTKSK